MSIVGGAAVGHGAAVNAGEVAGLALGAVGGPRPGCARCRSRRRAGLRSRPGRPWAAPGMLALRRGSARRAQDLNPSRLSVSAGPPATQEADRRADGNLLPMRQGFGNRGRLPDRGHRRAVDGQGVAQRARRTRTRNQCRHGQPASPVRTSPTSRRQLSEPRHQHPVTRGGLVNHPLHGRRRERTGGRRADDLTRDPLPALSAGP
jgi:hypothetical protein